MIKEKMMLARCLRCLSIGSILIFFLSIRVAVAIDPTEEGYRVGYGQSKEIDEHSVCKEVTNNHASGLDIFIPTKTSEEWENFCSSPPPGVTLEDCGPCSSPPEHLSGYSLNYLGRHRQCTGTSPGSWVHSITDSIVVTQTLEIVYSTVQGNWLPTNTYTETLQLNVSGDNTLYCRKHPVPILKAVYRVWGDTSVVVKTHTKAEDAGSHGSLFDKINRIDTFQRQSSNTILINGIPQVIDPGESYAVQNVTWNPADHGSGNSYLRISNDACSDYFDIEQYVDEADEQRDSSRVWIDSYIR